MLSPFNLPDAIVLLITDELMAPGDFLLYQLLVSHFKESKSAKCVILSVSEGIERWKAVASKSNLNLSQYLSSGSLTFVDVMPLMQSSLDAGQPSLQSLYQFTSSILTSSNEPTLIILDDITSLHWIGFDVVDISRFGRSLRALSFKTHSTLVIRHHTITPDEPDDLFRHLIHLCTYHLEVLPLTSGRSGTVSGEIALHPGMSTPPASGVKLLPRASAIQYRLTDNGANFFERGTSGGVL